MKYSSSTALPRKRRLGPGLFLLGLLALALAAYPLPPALAASRLAQSGSAPAISDIQLNLGDYPGGRLPRYAKLEITFQVETAAQNLQLPFDPAPPPGLQPAQGVSVDALFTPDNWRTVYRQPAFYYQYFADRVKDGKQWLYPTARFAWKARFTPNQAGAWQFRLVAQDAGGQAESPPQPFEVVPSTRPGFVRVSQADPRYFELDNGAYFPALGYNLNYDQVSWTSPRLGNEADFKAMAQNGIQLVRMWLSQWSIYGPSWNPWWPLDAEGRSAYVPYSNLSFEQAYPGSEVSLKLDAGYNPCMVLGVDKARPAVVAGASYRIRARYKTVGLAGPQTAGKPFGFVLKTGDWLWDGAQRCDLPGTGTVLSPYVAESAGWQVLEGRFTAGPEQNFLPNLYLAVENTTGGFAYIDSVVMEEDLGNGRFGPNILPKPSMAHHLYMDQRDSYAFDQVLDLAAQTGVYMRPVVMEKNDWIFNRIDFAGKFIPTSPLCTDSDPQNDPPECPGNGWFYGRQNTKVRWLQQAWWRYLQARWGYSTQIHSWELLNEGDPTSQAHFDLAQAFGQYMHQFGPNSHLVSTSFWHSFPREEFWANPAYPDIDFADVHQYIEPAQPGFSDSARAATDLSRQIGESGLGEIGKPVIRGETGFQEAGGPTRSFRLDTEAVWLHNLLWAGLNPGGLIESYWYANGHIYGRNEAGALAFDHRPVYRAYANFLRRIPLNNGFYQDAAAQADNPGLLVLGQKDILHGRLHLWIANRQHTWQNVVAGKPIPLLSGRVSIPGFQPGQTYSVQWWNTTATDPARQVLAVQPVTASAGGVLTLPVEDLATDLAVQVLPQPPAPATRPRYR